MDVSFKELPRFTFQKSHCDWWSLQCHVTIQNEPLLQAWWGWMTHCWHNLPQTLCSLHHLVHYLFINISRWRKTTRQVWAEKRLTDQSWLKLHWCSRPDQSNQAVGFSRAYQTHVQTYSPKLLVQPAWTSLLINWETPSGPVSLKQVTCVLISIPLKTRGVKETHTVYRVHFLW